MPAGEFFAAAAAVSGVPSEKPKLVKGARAQIDIVY